MIEQHRWTRTFTGQVWHLLRDDGRSRCGRALRDDRHSSRPHGRVCRNCLDRLPTDERERIVPPRLDVPPEPQRSPLAADLRGWLGNDVISARLAAEWARYVALRAGIGKRDRDLVRIGAALELLERAVAVLDDKPEPEPWR